MNDSISRRQMIQRAGAGFGSVALASMLADEGYAAADPLAPKGPHFRTKAKSVIWLFINGGPSHVDTWDYKPELERMDGKELEDVMARFIDGAYDVLVATTIIESGIDISNANTMLVNEAHKFGLSDLHQLRGRVGRSNRKAFCYLMVPPLSALPEESRKRLQALE